MKKQTAVEWLVEKILQKVQNYKDGDVETEEEPFIVEYVNRYNFNVDLTKFVQQAKEMEKEQIKNAYLGGYLEDIPYPTDSKYYDIGAEQYYNETFGETIVTEYRDGTIEVDEFNEE